MRSILHREAASWRQYAAAFVLFLLLAAVVIGKALLLDNCMAYDPSDDLNHTFTGLAMAKKMFANGNMPYFNYYNNFGTPLMGDALTYPFALQAIPYYFTDIVNYPLVSTINRFVLCVATLTALLMFYRTFQLSIFASAMAAMCVFFNFGFFWHFAHHSYQATVLLATCVLIAQRVALRNNNHKQLFISVALLSGLMIYSVNPNLILLSFIFFALQPLVYKMSLKTMAVNTGALLAGGLIGSIQIITNVLALLNSARSSTSYVDVFFIKFSWLELISRALFQDRPSGVHLGHIYLVVYFPMFLLLAYLIGLYLFFKENDNSTFAVSVAFGFLPLLLTGVLLVHTGIWQALPLLKSTDITRIMWLAMIFIGLGIGRFTDALQSSTINKRLAWLMVMVMTTAACLGTVSVVTKRSPALYLPGYWTAWALTAWYLLHKHLKAPLDNGAKHKNILFVSGSLVLLAIMSTYSPIIHYLGNWANPTKCRSLNSFTEIPAFDPNLGLKVSTLSDKARFAVNIDSGRGFELISETFFRHGGGGRSIALDGNLQTILLSSGLIEIDNPISGYHFTTPWDNAISNRLGLRYFATHTSDNHDNWTIIDRWGKYYIYENVQKPSLVYLGDGQDSISFIETFSIKGNDLHIDLPPVMNGGKLHVTITARPGFSVYVDGEKRVIEIDEFGFISAKLTSADQKVLVSYNPLDLGWLWQK